MQSTLMATAFSMASTIELAFIRARTKEGLQRARENGKILGRRKGTIFPLKLESRSEEVRELMALKISKRQTALKLKVSLNTLQRYL